MCALLPFVTSLNVQSSVVFYLEDPRNVVWAAVSSDTGMSPSDD